MYLKIKTNIYIVNINYKKIINIMKYCNRCNKEKLEINFKIKSNGTISTSCIRCLEIQKKNRDKNKCIHNKEKHGCKICSDSITVTIKCWLKNSKHEDKLRDRFLTNINFIDYDYCNSLILKYPNCIYCDVEMQYKIRQHNLATIERLNNTIGHYKGNCKLCCWLCNCGNVGKNYNNKKITKTLKNENTYISIMNSIKEETIELSELY